MTRETKIGLLVGLAFILVVGILLSEHITGATERPAAPLADAGQGINRGVAAPGVSEEPKPIEPQQPVPTPADLTPKPQVAQVTVVAPQTPAQPQQQPTVIVAQNDQPPAPAPTPVTVIMPPSPAQTSNITVVRAPTDPFSNDPVNKAAKLMGQELVPVNNVQGKSATVTPAVNTTTTTSAREYKAQAGDTLSRLASQVPGGNVKANRDAVVALNPILQKDPNRVLSGRTYLLPTQAAGVAKPGSVQTTTITVATKTTPADKAVPTQKAVQTKTVVADAGVRTYVVKAGDTLSKIASNEMGSKSEVPTLRTLNADVLKGSDVIKVNMKLKLPAAKASLASASIR